MFKVVSPLGARAAEPAAPPARSGEVRTVGFVWDHVFKGDEMERYFRAALEARHPSLNFVGHQEFGNTHDPDVIAGLPEALAEHSVDAVVSSVGACGSCTPAVVRAAIAAQRSGLRTVAVVGDGFDGTARAVSSAFGIPDLALVSYPGPGLIMADTPDVFAAKMSALADELADALLEKRPASGPVGSTPVSLHDGYEPHAVVCSGSFDEVEAHFLDHCWTDGLPVVPPTRDRVERHVAASGRLPDEMLGTVGPENRVATIWNVAVNALMAGCRPEYMPLVVAVAECLVDPGYSLGDFGCTPGIEPLVIASGPIVKALDFNSGPGVMRIGRQANSAIGRFVRLFLLNVAGLRLLPGADRAADVADGGTDNGAIAQNFNVVMAEDSDAMRNLGWPPIAVDRGFDASDDVVTVTSVIAAGAPIYSAGDSAADHLATIAEKASQTLGSWPLHGALYLRKRATWNPPLLLLSPGVAHRFAADGVTKADIREYLGEHCRIAADQVERDIWNLSAIRSPVNAAAQAGWLPEDYGQGNDPARLVRQILDPSTMPIVVGGHPGRNQSKLYVTHSVFGVVRSRRVPVVGSTGG